jgi:hypothetical protein
MILNVIDNRKRRYRWRQVKAVAEPTWHDNKCKDADQAKPVKGELDYEERVNISVQDAIQWANDLPYRVTLYLYEAEEA